MKQISKHEILLESLIAGGPRAILNQEADGQKQLVNSSELPVEMSAEDRKVLESWGVVLGEVMEDKLFCAAVLPKGWSKKTTDHSMWSKLIDDKGHERAAIFYKAAFYDRAAHLHVQRRLSPTIHQDDWAGGSKEFLPVIKDGDKIIWRGSLMSYDAANKRADKVLSKAYPDWKNTLAYWDVESFDKLPPSESEPPKGKSYREAFELYHVNGSFSDGTANETPIFESDAVALEKTKERLTKSFGGRYRVVWTLSTLDGKRIGGGTIELPAPEREHPTLDYRRGW